MEFKDVFFRRRPLSHWALQNGERFNRPCLFGFVNFRHQTEHGCKIETDRILASKFIHYWVESWSFWWSRQNSKSYGMFREKMDVFKFGTLFNILEFNKIRCWSTFLNAWDYVDLLHFYRISFKLPGSFLATLEFVELVFFMFGHLVLILCLSEW